MQTKSRRPYQAHGTRWLYRNCNETSNRQFAYQPKSILGFKFGENLSRYVAF